jgi:hypothetical protein
VYHDSRRQGREDQSGILHRRRSQPCFHFTSLGSPLAHFVTGLSHPASILEPRNSSFLVKRIHSFPPNNFRGYSRRRSPPSPRVYVGISTPGPAATINSWPAETLFWPGYDLLLCPTHSALGSFACLSACWLGLQENNRRSSFVSSLLSNTQWECSLLHVNLNNTAFCRIDPELHAKLTKKRDPATRSVKGFAFSFLLNSVSDLHSLSSPV